MPARLVAIVEVMSGQKVIRRESIDICNFSLKIYSTHLIKTPISSFPEEVIAWAALQGITCHWENYSVSPFPICLFKTNKGKQLRIHFVGLNSWTNAQPLLSEEFFKITTETFRANNQLFVNLWEDVWIQRNLQVKERLLSMLGNNNTLAGRLTKVCPIDKLTAHEFIEKWHVNGSVNNQFQYGIFLPENRAHYLPGEIRMLYQNVSQMLLAVATFGRIRKMKRISDNYRSGELVRFVTVGGLNIIGGLSKVLSSFQKDHNTQDIMTYADLDWSDGKSYIQAGFKQKEDKPPFSFFIQASDLRRGSSIDKVNNMGYCQGVNSGSRKWVKYYAKE
jgi:hypothetical protein